MRPPPSVDTTWGAGTPTPAKPSWGATHSLDVSGREAGNLDFYLHLALKRQCTPLSWWSNVREKSTKIEDLNKIKISQKIKKKNPGFDLKLLVIPWTMTAYFTFKAMVARRSVKVLLCAKRTVNPESYNEWKYPLGIKEKWKYFQMMKKICQPQS